MVYRMPRLEEYIAGALLANAPGWMIIVLISYLAEGMENILYMAEPIMIITYLASTIWASYMVCRIAYRDRMKIGVNVGASAILVNLLLFMGIARGIPLTLLIELCSVQILGGVLGAYIVERRTPPTS
ncbi:MAG: hypothetical protein QXI93_01895 [Candidatus Methanomethylicia archaeon]